MQVIATEGVAPVAELKFEPLAEKYKQAHYVGTTLIYPLLMSLALLLLLTEYHRLLGYVEGAVAIFFIINLIILSKAYSRKGYALREHDISYRSGVVFHKVTTIPYSKIQQVSIKQNPISRLFGLYSVDIFNGAQALSSLNIPGLTKENAAHLKDFITEKIRNEND